MIIMLSPVPFKTFSVASGNVYVADQFGIISNVSSTADQQGLITAGCSTLNPNPTNEIASLVGANFNTTADQQFVNINNSTRFQITKILVLNSSVNNPGVVAGGIYTGAGKTGTTIVGAGQSYSGLTFPGVNSISLTLAGSVASTILPAGTQLYLSLTTPEGAAMTADAYVFADVFP